VAAQSKVVQARLRLLLAEGALVIQDKSSSERIAEAQSVADGLPLHAWWAACLEARSKKQPQPEAGSLTRHLDPLQTKALLNRGRQVGR